VSLPVERFTAGGILTVGRCGRIQFISNIASRCLRAHFPPRAHSRILPPLLAAWIASGDATPYCAQTAGCRLTISLIDLSRNGARCYYLRESPIAPDSLTDRQVRILYWIGQGRTNPEIAIILAFAGGTIKKDNQSIFIKLCVHSRTAAAFYARRFWPDGEPGV
jgi:DNA-binding CsgD family transcriptional regulator